MLNTKWTGPDPTPELAGTPVSMASAATDDSGPVIASSENAAVIGLDWTMCSAIVVDDPLDVLRRTETFLQLFGDLRQLPSIDRSKRSFERFRDIIRLAQPKPVGRHFAFDQLFAITLDVLDENARPSIGPGKAREHDPRALGAQETLHDDRHRRHFPNPNLPEIRERARRKNGCPNLPNRRLKFFRSGDRYRFKNAGEGMSAAVLNRGRRPNDHALRKAAPKAARHRPLA